MKIQKKIAQLLLNKQNIFIIFCFIVIFVHFFQILYFRNGNYRETYDVNYWKDRYEHSQYQLPLSQRIVGDSGLYAYSGYRLIKGDNPFSINVDKPPLGKYLIGLSIVLLKSPAFLGLILSIGLLIVVYQISTYLFKEDSLRVAVITILLLDPLLFSQFWSSELDLLQLFFLLLNIYFLISCYFSKRHKYLLIIFSGLTLGLFSEIKPPIFSPVVFILEIAFLFFYVSRKSVLFFLFGLLGGIFIPYIRYLQLGNNVIDILKVHKFMISMYIESQLKVHFGAIWQTILFGKFPHITGGFLISIKEWWFMLPISVLISIPMSAYLILKKNTFIFWKGFGLFILFSLGAFTIIPSYPRYLIILLPFLYIFLVKVLETFLHSKAKLILFVFISYGVINAFFFLIPTPDDLLNTFYYSFSRQYFQDIYQENLAMQNHPLISRENFRLIAQKALQEATIKSIEITEKKRTVSKFSNRGYATIKVNYKTQNLGSFSEEKTVKLIKENSQWKVKWDWGIVLNDFRPGYNIEVSSVVGKRGTIKNPKGEVLAEDTTGYLVSINPEKIDVKKEPEMLNFVAGLEKQKPVHLYNGYLENNLPGEYVSILTSSVLYSDEVMKKLLSYKGVKISNYPSRIYFSKIDPLSIENTFYNECCTRIYSSYNYHGVIGIEKEYDKELSGEDGGTIILKDRNNRIIRKILQKKAKNGQEVIAPDL